MKQTINEIEINGIIYIPKDSVTNISLASKDGLPYVLIRTYSAGVHFGLLKERNGKEITLFNARRIWSWQGAFDLNQIAMEGADSDSKITMTIPEITLTEAIEIIPMSEKSIKSLTSIKEIKS